MNDRSRTVWRPYCQMKTASKPTQIVGAKGSYLITQDGHRLLDGMASWWSACHGHAHPHVVAAVQQQMECLPHVMFGGITHEPAERLAERLAEMLPAHLNHVFFCDSGSVAVEAAMKMAIGFWKRHGQPSRHRFLAFNHAYHGDTTGAMSLCDPKRSMHRDYGNGILTQIHCALPEDDKSEATLDQTIGDHANELAGVFIEPLVQGAGGMRMHDAKTVERISEVCRRHNVLLIADEIATGFGRTGTPFALDQTTDVQADIVCIGKALTAGTLTMAACVASSEVFEAFYSADSSDAFMHGPTFMANPLACAAANASLDLFEKEPRFQQAADMQAKLAHGLRNARQIPGVVDVRTKGAVGVIQVKTLDRLDSLCQQFLNQGVWLRPFGDCIYTTPPLNISDADLTRLCHTMVKTTETWATQGRESALSS